MSHAAGSGEAVVIVISSLTACSLWTKFMCFGRESRLVNDLSHQLHCLEIDQESEIDRQKILRSHTSGVCPDRESDDVVSGCSYWRILIYKHHIQISRPVVVLFLRF